MISILKLSIAIESSRGRWSYGDLHLIRRLIGGMCKINRIVRSDHILNNLLPVKKIVVGEPDGDGRREIR